MNRNVLIVLAGGFMIAIVVAIVTQSMLGGRKESGVPAIEKAYVLVAEKTLRAGNEIEKGSASWQAWPRDLLFSGAIVREKEDQSPQEASKGRLRRDVEKGEPIVKSLLVTAEKGNFLAASLSEGKRAVAISVSAQSMVGGFVSPGDRVDVILTYRVRLENSENPEIQSTVNKHVSETILENVRVLATDQEARRDSEKIKVARTVTLEVDGTGAETLSLASAMGDLSLALRGLGDEKVSGPGKPLVTDVKISAILGKLAHMKKTGEHGPVVRVYSGDLVQNLAVRPDAVSSP